MISPEEHNFDPAQPAELTIPEGFEGLIGTGQSILEQFQQLGLSTHTVMGLVFVGGLLLWLFGGKSLRIGFGLLGLLVGAQVGLLAPAIIGFDTSAAIAAITGGALGLLIGLVAFKFTVAWTLAVLLGVLGLLGSAAYFEVRPDFSAQSEEVSAERSAYDELYKDIETLRDQAMGRLPGEQGFLPGLADGAFADDPEARELNRRRLEAAEDGARQLSELFEAIRERLRPTWEQLPSRERIGIIAIALAGNVIGFSLGMIATKKSAMLITAFVGPLIWVPAGIWLAAALGAPGLEHLPTLPLVWALVWIVLSVLGLLIQWRRPQE